MFVDECQIEVIAGDGGDGCVSFRREKYVPRGGPDGGDGGDGGHVLLRVNPQRRTLNHLRHSPVFRAGRGQRGMGKQMTGARGADVLVEVPPGTVITDAESGSWIADARDASTELMLARGGRGGRGNTRFKRADRRTPRFAEEGGTGERRRLQLTLKLLADIGLVGLPNAGKSTLLARLSNARPKVADYPFTTLAPMLGIVPVGEWNSLVFADLPGLIEGAHEGRGLGQRFLRHIERTRVLLLLIEATDADPQHTLRVLRRELEQWSAALGRRASLVCYTKVDLLSAEARGALPELEGQRPPLISAHTGEGLTDLLSALEEKVLAVAPPFAEPAEESETGAPKAGCPAAGLVGGSKGPRPWPTRWVIPDRAGAHPQERGPAEERSGGEQAG